MERKQVSSKKFYLLLIGFLNVFLGMQLFLVVTTAEGQYPYSVKYVTTKNT